MSERIESAPNDEGHVVVRTITIFGLVLAIVAGGEVLSQMLSNRSNGFPNPNPIDIGQPSTTFLYGHTSSKNLSLRFSAAGAAAIATDKDKITIHNGKISYPFQLGISKYTISVPGFSVATHLSATLAKEVDHDVKPSFEEVTCGADKKLHAAAIDFAVSGEALTVHNATIPVSCNPGATIVRHEVELYNNQYPSK